MRGECHSGRDKAINPNHLHLALVGGSRERERDLTVIDGPERYRQRDV